MKIGGVNRLKSYGWLRVMSLVAAVLLLFLLFSFTVEVAFASRPAPTPEQESWRQGNCLTCGGLPDMAYLAEDGSRWLICSHCNTEWRFQRLECPYCGNQNQETLGYFYVEDGEMPQYRIYVCEECGKYIKAVDLRCTDSRFSLAWERLTTQAVEKYAQEMGYSAGWKTTPMSSVMTPFRRLAQAAREMKLPGLKY